VRVLRATDNAILWEVCRIFGRRKKDDLSR